MTTQFNYDKDAADLILAKFENIPVTWERDEGQRGLGHRLYFKGSEVGCNDDGLYLQIGDYGSDMKLVMRGLEIPFSNFSFWQGRRLTKFFKAKLKAYRRERAAKQEAAQQERLHGNLNTTLIELVKHGK